MSATDEQATGICKLKPSLVAPRVLTVGDPARAQYVSTLLQVRFFLVLFILVSVYSSLLHQSRRHRCI